MSSKAPEASEAAPMTAKINVLREQARSLAERVEELPESSRKHRMSDALREIADIVNSDGKTTL